MPDTLKPVAKAVAGLLAPIAVALIARGCEAIGVPVPEAVTPGALETLIVSVITAVVVWAAPRNTPKEN